MQEIDQLIKATGVTKSVTEARKLLGWSHRKLRRLTKAEHFPMNYGELISEVGSATSDLLARNIQQFVTKATPKDLHEKHKLASLYAKENDLIGDIVKTKAFLGNYGFNILAEDENEEKAILEFNEKYNVKSITRQMWYMAMAHDNLIVNWKNEGQKLNHILVLDPAFFWVVQAIEKVGDDWMQVYKDGIPQKKVFTRQDENLVTALQTLSRLDPKSVRDLPASRTEWTLWDEEEQGRVEIRTYNGYIDRMVEPRVQQIFFDLALRQMVKDGNMATFYHLKRIIWLIKIGAIKGDRDVPLFLRTLGKLTQEEADKWLAKFKNIEKSLMAVVPADQEHEFIAPPIDYLKLENFQAADWPVIRWSDIGPLLGYPKDKSTYASDYLKLKKAFATIQQWRGIIGDLLITIYRDILGVKGNIDVMWNEFILLEPRVLLERVKYLEQETGLSPQTAQKVLGFNPDMEKRLLAVAWEDPTSRFPIFESKQGLLGSYYQEKLGFGGKGKEGDGEPGRPTTDGPQSDKDHKGQQPRPSQAMISVEIGHDTALIPYLIWWEKLWIGGALDPDINEIADYKTEEYYHVETKKKQKWATNRDWKSKKLNNGVIMRLAKTKKGSYAVKVWLIPTSMVDSLKEAKKWVKDHGA